MKVTLRPIEVPADFASMADIMSAVRPRPVSVAELAEQERQLPPGTARHRTAAIAPDGLMAGHNLCERQPHYKAGSFYLDVMVSPRYHWREVGARLYDDAVRFAQANGATRLECEINETDSAWLEFALERGFLIDRRVFESSLDLTTFDESRFAGVIEAVEASGIRFTTLAATGDSEENRHRLYELSKRNSFDIPGHEGTFPAFAEMQQLNYATSRFRADGLIIAADGEQWIGQTVISYIADTNSTYTEHTGVERAYRGRKIALALKLLGIRWSRQIGAQSTRAHNDSENKAILVLNERLGYKPLPGYYRVLKQLVS